ncbi:MAG TPA: serine/threonine-protein kinase, partial [Planctomycetota bacterium]|nr:serine/threonine-protein kinase [Planctomycetota bacterium]
YVIDGYLGGGAYGDVYIGRDLASGLTRALKLVYKDWPLAGLNTEAALARVRAEFKLVQRLHHPNICSVLDLVFYSPADQNDGPAAPIQVMEYLKGSDLAGYLGRQLGQRLEPARACMILLQIAQAVDHAHQQGVVHQDLKLANVFCLDGPQADDFLPQTYAHQAPHVKVLDFSLAANAAHAMTLRTGSTGLIWQGTPQYLSPEQASGFKPHPSFDRWGLAVIAYELLAGVETAPFAGPTFEILIMNIQNPAIAWQPHEHLPPASRAIFERAFDKRSSDNRYSSCLEFVAALADALQVPAAVTAANVPVPGVVNTAAVQPTLDVGPVVPAPVPVPPEIIPPQTVLPRPSGGGGLRIAPAAPSNATAIGLPPLQLGMSHEFPTTAAVGGSGATGGPVTALDFSPTGDALAVGCMSGQMQVWDAATRKSSFDQVLHEGGLNALCYSPRGIISAGQAGQVVLYKPDSHNWGRIYSLGAPIQALSVNTAGTWIAAGGSSNELAVLRWSDSQWEHGWTIHGKQSFAAPVQSLAFSPDGTLILCGLTNGELYLWQRDTLAVVWRDRHQQSLAIDCLDFAPDGRLFYAGAGEDIHVFSAADCKPQTHFRAHDGKIGRVRCIPSNGLVVSIGADGVARVWDIGVPRLIAEYHGGHTQTTALAVSPGSLYLAVGGANNNVHLVGLAAVSGTQPA